MSRFSKRKSLSLVGCLCVLPAIACLSLQRPIVFRTIESPNNTYLIHLKRVKGAATNHVRADVFKKGQLLISDIWLQSGGDTFKPFESSYPDLRWLNENVLEFYLRESFDQGSDSLRVENKSAKLVSHLHVECINKFLLFDVPPEATIALEIPPPPLDSQWIAVEGLLSSGEKLLFTSNSFNRPSSHAFRSLYTISITDSELIIRAEDVRSSSLDSPASSERRGH
jgi:hypothetical protein